MSDLREAAEMALAKLDHLWEIAVDERMNTDVLPEIQALRQALAQPEQEPFGYFRYDLEWDGWVETEPNNGEPLYTAPPKREPLMTKYVIDLWDEYGLDPIKFAREIEKMHGIRSNT